MSRWLRSVWLPLVATAVVVAVLLGAAQFSILLLEAREKTDAFSEIEALLQSGSASLEARAASVLGDLTFAKSLAEGESALPTEAGGALQRSLQSLLSSRKGYSAVALLGRRGEVIFQAGDQACLKHVVPPLQQAWIEQALALSSNEALFLAQRVDGRTIVLHVARILGEESSTLGLLVLISPPAALLNSAAAPGNQAHLAVALGAGEFLHKAAGSGWKSGASDYFPARQWDDLLFYRGDEPMRKEIPGWLVSAKVLSIPGTLLAGSGHGMSLSKNSSFAWVALAAVPTAVIERETREAADGVRLLTGVALAVFVPAAFVAAGAFRRLARVRKQLDKTLEASPNGIVAVTRASQSPGYSVALITPAATEILTDPSKPPDTEVKIPDKIATIIRQTLSSKRSSVSEVRLFDDPPRWVLVRTAATDDGAVLVFVDTTDRRRQEEALRTTQQSLQLAARMSRIGAWVYDCKAGELWWSQEVRRIHSVPDDFVPTIQKAVDFYLPESRERILEVFDRCRKEGVEFDSEFEIRDARGRVLWVRAIGQAERDSSGGEVARVLGTFQDITETHESALALAESRELLSVAFWGSSLSVADWDVDAGTFIFDKNLLGMLGYGSGDVKQTLAFRDSLVPEEDRPALTQAAEDYFAGTAPHFEAQYRLRAKNGSFRWVLERSRIASVDAASKPKRLVGVITDVTRLKEAEQLLERALDHEKELVRQAKAAVEAKRDFLAMMSHEIRTPMNSILGFAEMLSSQPLNPEQAEFVATIRESGETLLRIINDVLDYSRIESGKLHIESLPYNPRDILASVVGLLAPTAKSKGIKLTSKVDASVPAQVMGDGGRVRQVMVNLAANAVKFTKEGSVTLSARLIEETSLLELAVKDTGPGIDGAKLASIFEPFTQADPSTSRSHGGTGLGLSICSKLVHLMGGTISATSKVGRGSEFSFTLPFRLNKGTAGLADANGQGNRDGTFAADHPLEILVVEDDRVNAKLTRVILERLGYAPSLVADGQAAVDAVSASPPDLILMDLRMPRMDGIEATRAIRKLEKQRKGGRPATIVAFTADVLPEGKSESLQAGMDDYLTKPVSSGKVMEVLLRADANRKRLMAGGSQ